MVSIGEVRSVINYTRQELEKQLGFLTEYERNLENLQVEASGLFEGSITGEGPELLNRISVTLRQVRLTKSQIHEAISALNKLSIM